MIASLQKSQRVENQTLSGDLQNSDEKVGYQLNTGSHKKKILANVASRPVARATRTQQIHSEFTKRRPGKNDPRVSS